MSEYIPRNWTCQQCGRVVGLVVRGNDRRVRLHVLRASFDPVQVLAAKRPVAVILDCGVVVCERCGAQREWIVAEHLVEDLLARRKARTFGLED